MTEGVGRGDKPPMHNTRLEKSCSPMNLDVRSAKGVPAVNLDVRCTSRLRGSIGK